jgi:hypothetical protein
MYNDDSVAKGRPIITKQALGRAIIQLRPTVQKRQKTVDSQVCWCYHGIGLLTSEAE